MDDPEEEYVPVHKHNSREEWNIAMKFISGVVSLGTVLVLGAYGYTWSETKTEQEEKRNWRVEHQRVLDNKFDELKKGQEKLEGVLNVGILDTKYMLQRILDEQKRLSDGIKKDDKNKFNR